MITLESTEEWLGAAQTAVTTLATLLTIGLAFLARPSRATLFWSLSFVLAMAASFCLTAGTVTENEILRRAALGALMGAPALLWSGFRFRWGEAALPWLGPVVSIGAAVAFVAVGDGDGFGIAYRAGFLVSSLTAGLLAVDILRSRHHRDAVAVPLAVASALFLVLGVASASGLVIDSTAGADQFALLRPLAGLGMLVYVAAAVAAAVGLARADAQASRALPSHDAWDGFVAAAQARLDTAKATGERASVVLVQLDDMAEIRQTVGSTALRSLLGRFEATVRASLPENAPVGSPEEGAVVFVIAERSAEVRERLRNLLDDVAEIELGIQLPIHPSASIGWAPTRVGGFDVTVLLYMARMASSLASEAGGDRWERVGVAVTNALLSP